MGSTGGFVKEYFHVSKNKKKTMQPPFGWRVDPNGNQRLMAYEPEAKIVRTIFQLANQGVSPDEIAELFNAAGIPFPGERLNKDYPEQFFRYMRWTNPEMEPIITPAYSSRCKKNWTERLRMIRS